MRVAWREVLFLVALFFFTAWMCSGCVGQWGPDSPALYAPPAPVVVAPPPVVIAPPVVVVPVVPLYRPYYGYGWRRW